MKQDKLKATARLLEIMDTLREQCPWDRKQTFETLRNNTIEETYELADAILNKDLDGIKEEAGDLLLHVVFYAKLGEEAGAFDYADVVNALCDKLVYRHPHIYGEVHADTPEEVKANWEALKLRKKNRRSGTLGGVPVSLPALVKAYRIGEKAAATGFDWEKKRGCLGQGEGGNRRGRSRNDIRRPYGDGGGVRRPAVRPGECLPPVRDRPRICT